MTRILETRLDVSTMTLLKRVVPDGAQIEIPVLCHVADLAAVSDPAIDAALLSFDWSGAVGVHVLDAATGAVTPQPARPSQHHEWDWDALAWVEPPPPVKTPEQIQRDMTDAVQAYLDVTARSRGYDGILSACSYAAVDNPFQAEGIACLHWRSAVWAACYAILAEVEAGTRPVPTLAELLAELPQMEWPA